MLPLTYNERCFAPPFTQACCSSLVASASDARDQRRAFFAGALVEIAMEHDGSGGRNDERDLASAYGGPASREAVVSSRTRDTCSNLVLG